MSCQDKKRAARGIREVKRKAVCVSQEGLLKTSYINDQERFPLVIEPEGEGLNLAGWARGNRGAIEEELMRHGAILFRGFNVDSVNRFGEFARAISPELLDYRERAAPRVEVERNIYSSTEYPADQQIPLHHEMSYSHNWPMKLWFHCVKPAEEGGATPIADDRRVFRRLAPRIKEVFMRKKVLYVRNYGDVLDLPWQEVFQTTDRLVVEEYCRQARTELEWKEGNGLRTKQVRQAVAIHPKSGEMVWFNHAHMFHISNLDPEVRESLLVEFGEEDLPRNAYYGDGTPIETSVLDEIRGVYQEAAVTFSWRQGDVLMVDNILASHGRQAYVGTRKIVVALAELYTNTET
jgi:alpha-ketoglutarate-dependent taurine dioxygenase